MTKKEKDAEKFAKNMLELEQHLGRDLRPDELMLLSLFASVINASEDDEEDAEDNTFHMNGSRKPEKTRKFKKTSECDNCRNFSIFFDWPEDLHRCMHACSEQAHVQLMPLLDPRECDLKKESKEVLKHMSECCCDKKEDKMTRFTKFSSRELDIMESAFHIALDNSSFDVSQQKLKDLTEEIRSEKRYMEKTKKEWAMAGLNFEKQDKIKELHSDLVRLIERTVKNSNYGAQISSCDDDEKLVVLCMINKQLKDMHEVLVRINDRLNTPFNVNDNI